MNRLVRAALAMLALPGAALAQPAPGTPPQSPSTLDQLRSDLARTAPNVPPPAADAGKWVPRDTADLAALDKITARVTHLQLRVGQSVQYATLTVTLRACEVRPPDMAEDAAAYLVIADSRPGAPGFQGWMLENEPALGVFQHPVYDIRLTGCH